MVGTTVALRVRMIRSLSLLFALTLSTFVVACTADADPPAPDSTTSDETPVVVTDAVQPAVGRCPLPTKRPVSCAKWLCEPGAPGCPAVCRCWD